MFYNGLKKSERKAARKGCLYLSVLRLHRLRPYIVRLVLILRLHLPGYTVELLQILFLLQPFLLFFVHINHPRDSLNNTEKDYTEQITFPTGAA